MLRLVAARGVHTAATPEVRAASQSLLPPIPLYRALLRVHRRLSPEMRSLGDDYVKAEFRRHREVTNPLYIVGFCSQWKMYLDALLADSDPLNYRGRGLDPDLLEKEQLYQLYELKLASKEVFDPENAQAHPPPDFK